MRLPLPIAIGVALLATGPAMSKDRIAITSPWGTVTAELADNDAYWRDHLRQEKTGTLPASLPQAARRLDVSAGMLGLWGDDDLVIYYRGGRVPPPGVVVLGRVTGDVAMFDRPGSISVQLRRTMSGASTR